MLFMSLNMYSRLEHKGRKMWMNHHHNSHNRQF